MMSVVVREKNKGEQTWQIGCVEADHYSYN